MSKYVEIIYLKSNFSKGLQESDCKIMFTGWKNGHLWGTTKMQDPARRSKAIVAISAACLFPFLTGRPEATM